MAECSLTDKSECVTYLYGVDTLAGRYLAGEGLGRPVKGRDVSSPERAEENERRGRQLLRVFFTAV